MLKRTIYITLFTLLGILLSFLVHAVIEIPVINLLLKDFNTYGLGLSWENWVLIHNISAVILFLLGTYFGYRQGKHWWQAIYVKKDIEMFI